MTMVKINNSSLARRPPSKRGQTGVTMIIAGLVVGCFLAHTFLVSNSNASNAARATYSVSDSDSGAAAAVVADAPLLHMKPLPQKAMVTGTGTTVGYAVSVTGCGSDPITEGAAVLKHSIHQASSRAGVSKYDYQMYAIVHPDAVACGEPLTGLGFKVLIRNTPVEVKDIQGDFLRLNIEKNGCCGEKELIKIEAYTLIEHPVVVHMDLDTLVLKPMDAIFDHMMGSGNELTDKMWKDEATPETINAYFTRDYNMVPPDTKYKPVQGGFLVLRPSMPVYEEFVEIIRVGDFRKGGGWGGKVGPFYGSMTFQGIIPYYYDYLHQGTALELNRCVYNQMCDNPRDQRTVDNVVHGNCRTGQANENCEDCRERALEDVVTSHFTLCQKPWWCLPQDHDRIQERLCRKLHQQWYRIRSDLEKSWGRSGMGPGTFQVDQFFGYCNNAGKGQYVPIEQPFGPV